MTDDIKEKIALAEKSVEDIKDKTLKEKAFEIVLNNLMKGNNTSDDAVNPNSQNPPPDVNTTTTTNKFANLLNVANITEEQIHNVIDMDGEVIHLIKPVPGNTESKKQGHTALVLLTISHYLKSNREISVKELKKVLQDQGIGSLQNLSGNLKGFENYLVMKGVQGSNTTIYRITNPGITKGIELIKEMI